MKNDDLEHSLKDATRGIKVEWSAEREERALKGLYRKKRHRNIRNTALVTALFAVIISGVAIHFTGENDQKSVIALKQDNSFGEVIFVDGSHAQTLSSLSRIRIIEDTKGKKVKVALESGGARFEVTRDPGRTFEVDAGNVSVIVIGTVFSVDRLEGKVRVSVERGRVRVVTSDGKTVELGASESGVYTDGTPAVPKTEPSSPAAAKVAPEPEKPARNPEPLVAARIPSAPKASGDIQKETIVKKPPPPAPVPKTWRSIADEGHFEQAYAMLKQPGVNLPEDPGELLYIADLARLSSEPEGAIAPLTKVVREFPSDPRASLAAFTLGRVFLEKGRFVEAAHAFGKVLDLHPTDLLAEDALANEVEALSKSGLLTDAHRKAEEYLLKYPGGQWTSPVMNHGAIK